MDLIQRTSFETFRIVVLGRRFCAQNRSVQSVHEHSSTEQTHPKHSSEELRKSIIGVNKKRALTKSMAKDMAKGMGFFLSCFYFKNQTKINYIPTH
jgi:hypothetical protein